MHFAIKDMLFLQAVFTLALLPVLFFFFLFTARVKVLGFFPPLSRRGNIFFECIAAATHAQSPRAGFAFYFYHTLDFF